MGDTGLTTRAFSLLNKLSEHGKLTPEENQELLEYIKEMASTNITARLESKIESMSDSMNAKMDAQNSKYNLLIWMIGIGVALLIASNFIS